MARLINPVRLYRSPVLDSRPTSYEVTIGGRPHVMSAHAVERMRQRRIAMFEVREALTRPEKVVRSPNCSGPMYQRGRIGVATIESGWGRAVEISTVMRLGTNNHV